jgi:hypothetical protein
MTSRREFLLRASAGAATMAMAASLRGAETTSPADEAIITRKIPSTGKFYPPSGSAPSRR